jgi:hypothetical protein
MDFRLTLETLARTFTVREIMVPVGQLVRGANEQDALRLLRKNPEFDMIPIPDSGEPSMFLDRDAKTVRSIERSDLISDGTSILELVDVLAERGRVFVFKRQQIGGYVHFSDLNNHITKIPFFVIFESLETSLATTLRENMKVTELPSYLSQETLSKVNGRMKRLRAKRADFSWTSALDFRQVMDLALKTGILAMTAEEKENLIESRNCVAHAARQFVERLEDVKDRANAKTLCLGLLSHRGFNPRVQA